MQKKVALVACMDEDLDYGEGVVVFGTAGSLITKVGGGNQTVYPDEKRELVEKTRGVVFGELKRLAEKMGMKLVVTSHAGCGAGAAQEIKGREALMEVTGKMCDELGLEYAGHIPHASEPVEIGEAGFKAHIGRPEEEHHHGARRVIVTVGGGITEQEIQMVEADGYGDGFVVSADWVRGVLERGEMSEEEVKEWLELHVDIADGIADGVSRGSSVRVYNANRLDKGTADRNYEMVVKMLRELRQEN